MVPSDCKPASMEPPKPRARILRGGFLVANRSGSRVTALIGLIIAFGWPLIFLALPGLSSHQIASAHDDAVTIVAQWSVVVALCLIAFGLQRWRPSDLGIRRLGWRDILASLGGVVVASILSGVASRLVHMPSSLSDISKVAAVPVALRLALVLTAAICEEFSCRGFGIEEMAHLIGNRWMAGLLSLIFFTLAHAGLYGMSAALVIPGSIGAVLTVLYLWRRNLLACMLMHAIIDGFFLVLIPGVAHTR